MSDVHIKGGYYIKARCIQDSEIAYAPPYIREIWEWFIKEANHKDNKMNGTVIRRGQCVRDFNDIREGLSWFVGFRKEKYKKWQVEKAVRWLRNRNMLQTQKLTRKMLFTVVNYDYFQNPKNYDLRNENESNAENNYESDLSPVGKFATKATPKASTEQQGSDTINKNVKNAKKCDTSLIDQCFDKFWVEYPKKVGKKPAKKIFSKIYNELSLSEQDVLLKTMIVTINRLKESAQWQQDNGKFIPHPTTWLNQERWSDEILPAKNTQSEAELHWGQI